jgi:hypothetical protein
MIFHVGSKYGAAPGIYLAHFRGVTPRPAGKFGPSVNWDFQIVERLTGQPIQDNDQVDVTPYVGGLYRIRVDTKPQGKGVRVTSVMPAPKGKEVPRVGFNQPAQESPRRWVSHPRLMEGTYVELTRAEVQELIDGGMDPQEIWIHDGDEWRRAPEFGFTTCPTSRLAPPPPRTRPDPNATAGDGRSTAGNGKAAAVGNITY